LKQVGEHIIILCMIHRAYFLFRDSRISLITHTEMVELHLSRKKVMVELHSGKKQVVVELHLGSNKVFPQKYHTFDRVRHLENTYFLSHLQV